MLAAAPVTISPTSMVLPFQDDGRVHQPPEGDQTLSSAFADVSRCFPCRAPLSGLEHTL